MKTILCYGDSNTWGAIPAKMERFGRWERWPGVLQQELGDDFYVIEEGLNSRTTVWDDPVEGDYGGHKNGRKYLIPCLESHKPLDLAIILLGANDLKKRFNAAPADVAEGAARLVEIVQRSDCGPQGAAPQVLLIAPPPLGRLTYFAEFFEGATEKSKLLGARFRRMARQLEVPCLDAGEIVVSSDLDGIHWEASEHLKLGRAVAAQVRAMLG